jgi:hypothetical protein
MPITSMIEVTRRLPSELRLTWTIMLRAVTICARAARVGRLTRPRASAPFHLLSALLNDSGAVVAPH